MKAPGLSAEVSDYKWILCPNSSLYEAGCFAGKFASVSTG